MIVPSLVALGAYKVSHSLLREVPGDEIQGIQQ